MALVPVVMGLIQRDFLDIAGQVESAFKAEVQSSLKRPAESTGQASGSIHIMPQSETRILVGSSDQHLNFLIKGNGGRIIYPVRAKALGYRDGSPHGRSTPYKGQPEILTRVANKFR